MARGEDREQLLQEVSDLDQQLHSFVANNSTEYGEPQEEVKGCKRFLKALQQVKNITIEPILFLYLLSWTIQSSISTNLLLDKVCIEKNYSSEICANLSSYPNNQIEVQRVVTKINMYMDLLTNIPSVLFVLFLGSWSDKHGRKLPMILPLVGSLLSTVLYLMNAYWFSLPALYILLSGVPRALTGGFITMIMASYAYISDITKIRSRTMRIAILDLFMFLGAPLGLLLSDVTFYSLGYLGIYGLSALLFLIAILYAILRIEDTRGRFSKYHLEASELAQTPGNMCKDLVDINNVKKSIAVCFKPRRHKLRTKILSLMAAMCVLVFVFGTTGVDYLYTKRKFGWTYDQYVHLGLVEVFVGVAGNSVVLPLVSYKLQVDDSVIGFVGSLFKIASLIIKGLAAQPWMLYLSSCVNFPGGLPLIIIRSMMSKIIPSDELGMIFSMLASWESILPLVSHPLCTLVYNATIKDFPGTVYLMSSLFVVISTGIFVWLIKNRNFTSPEPHVHEDEIIQSVES